MTGSRPMPMFDREPEPESSAMTVAQPAAVAPTAMATQLADLKSMELQARHGMSSLPIEMQGPMLKELSARRENFRDWLWSQLIEGVHYGYPPGCEPKWAYNQQGEKIGTKDWRGNTIPLSSWQPKPSLYASGADFVVEICGLIDSYEPNEVAWKQMGAIKGMACVTCRLHSKATGDLVGESLGAHYDKKDAEKAANKALKMASKAAKVGAVINAYGLRDLFTQDMEPKPPRGENPEADRSAPKADTRAARGQVSQDDLNWLYRDWKKELGTGDKESDRAKFSEWVEFQLNRTFDVYKVANWTAQEVADCRAVLNPQEGE